MLGPQNVLFMYRIYHCHLRPYINKRWFKQTEIRNIDTKKIIKYCRILDDFWNIFYYKPALSFNRDWSVDSQIELNFWKRISFILNVPCYQRQVSHAILLLSKNFMSYHYDTVCLLDSKQHKLGFQHKSIMIDERLVLEVYISAFYQLLWEQSCVYLYINYITVCRYTIKYMTRQQHEYISSTAVCILARVLSHIFVYFDNTTPSYDYRWIIKKDV